MLLATIVPCLLNRVAKLAFTLAFRSARCSLYTLFNAGRMSLQNGASGSKQSGSAYKVIGTAKRNQPTLSNSRGTIDLEQNGTDIAAGKRVKVDQTGVKGASQKLAPLFARSMSTAGGGSSSSDGAVKLRWEKALGPEMSCLYGTYGKPFDRSIEGNKSHKRPIKIACFDLDGCVVKPKGGRTWPSVSDPFDFEQAFPKTFERVKQEYEDGSCIVIVSNQLQSDVRSKKLTTWKIKMENIARAIDCPLAVFAALAKDGFRKPGRRIWDEGIVPAYLSAGGCTSDIVEEKHDSPRPSTAFFVGDAAGRVGDHADTDRKWAMNVGMPFFTPEEYFLGRKAQSFTLSGWRPTLNEKTEEDDSLPANFFAEPDQQSLDLVLFVGPPAAGKTSFYRYHFAGRDYAWVNQDTLGSASKCQAAVRKHLEQDRSVVVDNTNRNAVTRHHYLELAHAMSNVRVRCIYFDVSKELCRHNNFFRVRAGLQSPDEARHLLPEIAFSSYFNSLEPPRREEGFDADIVVVRWSFRGGDRERERWLKQWD